MLTRADYRWSCGGYHHRAHKPPVQRPKKQRKVEKPTPIVDKGLKYEIQSVVKSRVGMWGPEYLVHWRGYSQSENSWIGELPVFFKKQYPKYKPDDDCSDCETDEYDSESDDDSDSSDDEEEDEEEDEDEEMMHKRARTAKAKMAHDGAALTKQCDAVSALLALSKAVTKLYENDTESDSDTD
jgi:hypothetical protein